jgi:hypothetical protein
MLRGQMPTSAAVRRLPVRLIERASVGAPRSGS